MDENFFIDYDKLTGEIIGFYTKERHKDKIPEDSIEITKEKHDEIIKASGTHKINLTTLKLERCEQTIITTPIVDKEKDKLKAEIESLKKGLSQAMDVVGYLTNN